MGPSKSLLATRLLWPSVGITLLALYIHLVIHQPGQQVEAIKAKKILYGLAIAHLLGIHPKDIHNAIMGGGERRQIIHPMPHMPPMPMPHPLILPTPSMPSCYKPKKRCRKKMKALQSYDLDDDDHYEEHHHFEDDTGAFEEHEEHYSSKPSVHYDDDDDYSRDSTPTYMDDEPSTSIEDPSPDSVDGYPEDDPQGSYEETPEVDGTGEESKEFHKVTQLPKSKKLQKYLRFNWKSKGEKRKKYNSGSTAHLETIQLGDKPHPSTQQKYKKYKQLKKKKSKGRTKDSYFFEETKPVVELDSGESQKVETTKETKVKKSIKNYFKYFWKEPKRGKARKKLKRPKESGTLTEPPKAMHHFAVPDVVPMPNIAFQVAHEMPLPPHHPMPMPPGMPIGAPMPPPPGPKLMMDHLGQQYLASSSEVVLEQHVMHPFRRKDPANEESRKATQLDQPPISTTTPPSRVKYVEHHHHHHYHQMLDSIGIEAPPPPPAYEMSPPINNYGNNLY